MRVLVTGCGGFLGSEIVRQLVCRGDEVVGVSRGEYPDLNAIGMTHRRGDLVDAAFTRDAIDGVDAVVHTAAVAGVWGPWEHFHSINTVATENVIGACENAHIQTLVFTSSPSVTFAGDDQSGVDESVPYPTDWLCHYPHTKALAEQAVLKADTPSGLRTCALRPHLIWGNDDPHILPRLVSRAKSGRLRIVGDGTNRVDTVHVINAAAAHLDAVDVLSGNSGAGNSELPDVDAAAGRAYFITQDEPVDCWGWISQVCELAGVSPPTKKISAAAAYRIGGVLETVYKLTGRQSEPLMTRFVAAQMAKDHYFDISAAKQRLGYKVRISMDKGLEMLRQHWRAG